MIIKKQKSAFTCQFYLLLIEELATYNHNLKVKQHIFSLNYIFK